MHFQLPTKSAPEAMTRRAKPTTDLLERAIGTADEEILRNIIIPPQRPLLKVRVYWKHGPPNSMVVTQAVKQYVFVIEN